jgi:hypothetical protein
MTFIHDVPIGLEGSDRRRECDSMGEIEVAANRYWGAQTQRSLRHFSLGGDRMPKAVYHAYGYVKKACALVNAGRLGGSRIGSGTLSSARLTRPSPVSSTSIIHCSSGRLARSASEAHLLAHRFAHDLYRRDLRDPIAICSSYGVEIMSRDPRLRRGTST